MKKASFWGIGIVLLSLLFLGVYAPLRCLEKNGSESEYSQITRVLMLAFYSYAQDHNGNYPNGKSSTEVFQQLIDQGYLSDATLLYVGYPDLPNKFPATGKKIKPENVCWDVTSGIDSSSPEKTPTIFFSGYTIKYQAGAPAVLANRTWSQWWIGEVGCKTFIAIGYKDITGQTITALDDGSIPNFIPADFDAKGKTYRQLTP